METTRDYTREVPEEELEEELVEETCRRQERRGNLKRNLVLAAVLLFVCASVYLNWSYSRQMGEADPVMAEAEDAAMAAAEARYTEAMAEEEAREETSSPYFASARLTRQQSRDEALSLLETAAGSENASQETIDSAMASISAMATRSLQEAQIENLLLAKDFAECVAYISDEGVTVAVPAPVGGLSEAAVARITDTITAETDFTAADLKLIEIRDTGEEVGLTPPDLETAVLEEAETAETVSVETASEAELTGQTESIPD